jgi:hypothetical protein
VRERGWRERVEREGGERGWRERVVSEDSREERGGRGEEARRGR